MSASFTLPIPTYQSNARVQALKIKAIIPNSRGYELHFEDERFCPHLVCNEWMIANGAGAGGYAVWSIGGHLGFQNAAAFEAGYTLVADGELLLTGFKDGQWWVQELETAVAKGTLDQKRALSVARNLLRMIAEGAAPAPDRLACPVGPATQAAREVIDEAAEMRRAEWHAEMRADAFGYPHE